MVGVIYCCVVVLLLCVVQGVVEVVGDCQFCVEGEQQWQVCGIQWVDVFVVVGQFLGVLDVFLGLLGVVYCLGWCMVEEVFEFFVVDVLVELGMQDQFVLGDIYYLGWYCDYLFVGGVVQQQVFVQVVEYLLDLFFVELWIVFVDCLGDLWWQVELLDEVVVLVIQVVVVEIVVYECGVSEQGNIEECYLYVFVEFCVVWCWVIVLVVFGLVLFLGCFYNVDSVVFVVVCW